MFSQRPFFPCSFQFLCTVRRTCRLLNHCRSSALQIMIRVCFFKVLHTVVNRPSWCACRTLCGLPKMTQLKVDVWWWLRSENLQRVNVQGRRDKKKGVRMCLHKQEQAYWFYTLLITPSLLLTYGFCICVPLSLCLFVFLSISLSLHLFPLS